MCSGSWALVLDYLYTAQPEGDDEAGPGIARCGERVIVTVGS